MNKPSHAMKIVAFCVGFMFVGGLTDMYFKEQRHRRLTREHKLWDDEQAGKEAKRDARWRKACKDYRDDTSGACPPSY